MSSTLLFILKFLVIFWTSNNRWFFSGRTEWLSWFTIFFESLSCCYLSNCFVLSCLILFCFIQQTSWQGVVGKGLACFLTLSSFFVSVESFFFSPSPNPSNDASSFRFILPLSLKWFLKTTIFVPLKFQDLLYSL